MSHETRPATPSCSRVVIVSDGSASPAPAAAGRRSLAARLREEAAIISRLTALTVTTTPVSAADDESTLIDAIQRTGGVGAIFLTGVEAGRAEATRRAVDEQGGPVVVTDQDATAMAVTASLLPALARAGLEPGHSRVVITGAPTAPLLRPLLITAGIGEIDSWNAWDATNFGLKRLVYGADAVIDLIGRASHKLHFDRAQPIIISPSPRIDASLSVPGLLAAVLRCSARKVDTRLYYECALTLVASTPPDRLLPEPGSHLAESIASAALAVLRRRRHRSAAVPRNPSRPLLNHRPTAAPI